MFVLINRIKDDTVEIKAEYDIADDMLGLSRLFADDTSIGHTALDEFTLKNMINIDLNNIKKWGDTWKSPLMPYLSNFNSSPPIQTRSNALLTSAKVILVKNLLSSAVKIV
jgi:hypothetical protein